jgi:hypothetical protein
LLLNKGDLISIYGDITSTINQGQEANLIIYGSGDRSAVPVIISSPLVDLGICSVISLPSATNLSGVNVDAVPTYITVSGNTIFPDSETDAFMIDEAAESIVSKYIGRDNSFYSDYLDTCAGNFSIMRGLHVRGYTMGDKPFSMSFEDWWEGVNPILNLGLGYEEIGGTEFIRCEEKAYFYDSTKSLNLDYVSGIVKTYDRKKIIKSIGVGYKKWSAESASGIDDPQAKLTFATLFEQLGEDMKIESGFIAASLSIEQTRRNRVEFGKDWRLDEEVIIINVTDDSTPILPETDGKFDSVTGLLNSETRYNIILSSKRNLLRWLNVILGCLQSYLSTPIKFVKGEGNYDMISDYTCGGDCEDIAIQCAAMTEGADQEIQFLGPGIGYLHKPDYWEFTHDLTWDEYKIIRDNRNQAIGVSESNSGHVTLFIDNLEWNHINGKATVTGWIR